MSYRYDRHRIYLIMELELPGGGPMVCVYEGNDGADAERCARDAFPDSKVQIQRIANDEELLTLARRNVVPVNKSYTPE